MYFRDTAHGFLAWAVASLATAALLTSVIGAIVGGSVQAGASMVTGVASGAGVAVGSAVATTDATPEGAGGPMGYFVDSLFRTDAAAAAASPTEAAKGTHSNDMAEVTRIFLNVRRSEPLPAEDARYVGQIVARSTGLSQADSEKRVADVYARAQSKLNNAEVAARDATDKARKASAYSALWLFISLLIGAFVASLAATFGGQRRDA